MCGVASPLVYLATVLLGDWGTPDYSHISMAVSELSEVGAPMAGPCSLGFSISAVLALVFGFGVWRVAAEYDGPMHMSGALLMAYGAMALLLATVFPMDPLGTPLTFPGTMHLVFVAISAFILLGAILFGGWALRGRVTGFWTFSVLTAVAMLTGGAAAGAVLAFSLPLQGLAERVTLASYLAWMLVLSLVLLRGPAIKPAAARRTRSGRQL